jgi:hypothetical protein
VGHPPYLSFYREGIEEVMIFTKAAKLDTAHLPHRWVARQTQHQAWYEPHAASPQATPSLAKIKMMVIFGAANLVILLVVMELKRYAFTSLWCAYAAVASVIILAYFWSSHRQRPFLYA